MFRAALLGKREKENQTLVFFVQLLYKLLSYGREEWQSARNFERQNVEMQRIPINETKHRFSCDKDR